MNWKLVLGLGITGALPPALTLLLGGSPVVAAAAWTVLAALGWVPAVLWARDPKPFLTLVLVGAVAGVVAGIIDAAMLGDPMLFVMALIIGIAWGAIFGGVAVVVQRIRGRASSTAS